VLREYEQLNYREIAHILKKPEGTVKTLIFRARASLQEMMLPYVKEMQGRVR
jgi:DNA-directed RNA polymerase specialized sigma24 family protein